jgi:purine-binding chemotaxis protein CheW
MPDAAWGEGLAASAETVLRRRAEALAVAAEESEAAEGMSLLLFRIADEWYAVEAGDVREIFQDYAVTPVPCVPDFILGVVNIRGEILSVTDPARLMGLGSIGSGAPTAWPAVVVTNQDVATALVVDEVGDIVEVASDALEPPISGVDRLQAEFIAGSVFVSDRMVGLLNVERVLQPIGS